MTKVLLLWDDFVRCVHREQMAYLILVHSAYYILKENQI